MNFIKNTNFKNKNVIIRVDFNVPLDDNLNITDDTRIIYSLPTINKVINDGGRAIIISHLGRPKDKNKNLSLKNIIPYLSNVTNKDIIFIDEYIENNTASQINNLPFGSIILLENLRFYPQEEKNDIEFAQELKKLADVYINDAFGVSHRKNTSIYDLPKLFNEKYIGFLLEKEITVINKILNSNEKPVTAIIAGSKVSSKLPIINNLMNSVDNIIIGGAMMFSFAKAVGGKIGKSIVEDDFLNICIDILKKAKEHNVNIILPVDTIIAKEFNNDSPKSNVDIDKIPDGFIGLDIGEKSIKIFSEIIKKSKTILWNGPMGVFEMPNFANGTKEIGNAVIEATQNGAFSLVGGGDSVAAAKQFNMDKYVSYISTGGGAMLESLEGKILPGIQVFID